MRAAFYEQQCQQALDFGSEGWSYLRTIVDTYLQSQSSGEYGLRIRMSSTVCRNPWCLERL